METKRCSKCKVVKPISEFYKDLTRKDKHRAICKKCLQKYCQTEECKANQRKYKQTPKGKATKKRYMQTEKYRATQRRRFRNEKYRAYENKRAQTEKRKEWVIKYRQSEKVKKRAKEYRNSQPEAIKAREAVHNATRSGKLPKPTTLKCVKCGKQAEEYHHYKGYAKEHWLDVQPVCTKCHGKLNQR